MPQGKKRKLDTCSAYGRLCGKRQCETCFNRSLASSARIQSLVNEGLDPLLIAAGSTKKVKWLCNCGHSFMMSCRSVTGGHWCPYCVSKKLCGDPYCVQCFNRSVASSARAEAFFNPGKDMLKIAISSCAKYNWLCECGHVFSMRCSHIQTGKWCPFCSKHRLCGDIHCLGCFNRSMASSIHEESFMLANPEKDMLKIAVSTRSKYSWSCACGHVFVASCDKVSSGRWCPQCAGRICGKKECTKCAPPCDICAVKSFYTLKTGKRACYKCYILSGESRAKVRLEIFFLAEIQRLCTTYEFLEPTSWDCAVLPGLSYKPDMLWAFDRAGNLFNIAGSCKLSLDEIGQVIVLEVLEIGIAQHSIARQVPDYTREAEIRASLSVVVDFVYVVVAAYNHPTADPSDKFFTLSKETNTYGVVATRKQAWKERVCATIQALQFARKNMLGTTVFIGS